MNSLKSMNKNMKKAALKDYLTAGSQVMELRRKHEIVKSTKDFKSIFPKKNGNFHS